MWRLWKDAWSCARVDHGFPSKGIDPFDGWWSYNKNWKRYFLWRMYWEKKNRLETALYLQGVFSWKSLRAHSLNAVREAWGKHSQFQLLFRKTKTIRVFLQAIQRPSRHSHNVQEWTIITRGRNCASEPMLGEKKKRKRGERLCSTLVRQFHFKDYLLTSRRVSYWDKFK